MNQKNIAIAAVLAAALLAGIFSATTPMVVYAEDDYEDEHDDDNGDGDYSGTNTEQKLKQSNVGNDASTNFNCGENDINSGLIDVQACGTIDIGEEIEALTGLATAAGQ